MSKSAFRHQRREPTRAQVRSTINVRELARESVRYGRVAVR